MKELNQIRVNNVNTNYKANLSVSFTSKNQLLITKDTKLAKKTH